MTVVSNSISIYLNLTSVTKGQIENNLIEVQENHPEKFTAYFFRPGSVLLPGIAWKIAGVLTRPVQDSVGVEVLAAAMIDVAFKGWDTEVIEHQHLKSRGEALLCSISCV